MGVNYLIGVASQVVVTSYLTTPNGQPLAPIDDSKLLARGAMTGRVS